MAIPYGGGLENNVGVEPLAQTYVTQFLGWDIALGQQDYYM